MKVEARTKLVMAIFFVLDQFRGLVGSGVTASRRAGVTVRSMSCVVVSSFAVGVSLIVILSVTVELSVTSVSLCFSLNLETDLRTSRWRVKLSLGPSRSMVVN
jgi:hypothetical protein